MSFGPILLVLAVILMLAAWAPIFLAIKEEENRLRDTALAERNRSGDEEEDALAALVADIEQIKRFSLPGQVSEEVVLWSDVRAALTRSKEPK